MGSNQTGRKSLDAVARDPRVVSVWREDDAGVNRPGPSYWVRLATGYTHDGCTHIHEDTIADVREALSCVQPTTCT